MQDLLEPAACREVIRQARWEQGQVCPHCGGRHVVLAGQFTVVELCDLPT